MKNRNWKREKSSRQDSQESTNSTQTTTSSSIREFELFQQFCSDSSPTWEVPCEANEVIYTWDTTLHESYAGMIADQPASPLALQPRREGDGAENPVAAAAAAASDKPAHEPDSISHYPGHMNITGSRNRRKISVSEKPIANAKNTTCRVLLLNNAEHLVEVNKRAKGQCLFDAVCEHINLVEKDYFSCSYLDKDGHKVWLNMDKKLCKQIKDASFRFAFEVKFYPSDFEFLQEDITRYLLCLQVQKDISSGRLPCSFMTYALLGSYLVQSELGDHEDGEMASVTSYVKDLKFAPHQTEELLEKIVELHRTHRKNAEFCKGK